LMAHTAFRRDPYDEKVLLPFARAVATPEVLRKLFVLTAADLAAVGPGVLTKWKESLLIELYLRTLPEVSGERDTGAGPERVKKLAAEVAVEVAGLAKNDMDVQWIESQLDQFPVRYLYGTPPARIAAHLTAIQHLLPDGVLVEDTFNDTLSTCEYTVMTFNDLTPGIFSKIAGVMAAMGLQILDAQIITREDGVVVDTFQVSDPDYAGMPPLERRAGIGRTIAKVLHGHETVEKLMGRGSRISTARRLPSSRQSTEVQVDNETSDRATIIDVFADDRQGLLYVITHAIFKLGLSVQAARISTRLDQVADVFYVTDVQGAKLQDHSRLETIRATIKEDVDRFLGEKGEKVGELEGQSSYLSS